jgi:hypothetical protein
VQFESDRALVEKPAAPPRCDPGRESLGSNTAVISPSGLVGI